MGFLKMKGARDLNRRELAVLRELVPWRDKAAAAVDRATFRVLGNEQLLDIARTQPASRDALGKIKGMPRGVLEQRGAELLDAVQRALAVPESDLPRFPRAARWDRDPDFDARVSALKTARDAAAKRLTLDPGVLCSRDRMEAVARRNPETMEFLRIKVATAKECPSVTSIWPGANWCEREAFDLFGIHFTGHPDLTRIYMPDDYPVHPMRKEIPLEGVNATYDAGFEAFPQPTTEDKDTAKRNLG